METNTTPRTEESWEEEFDETFAAIGIVGERKFAEFLPFTYEKIKEYIHTLLQQERQKAEEEKQEIFTKIDGYLEGLWGEGEIINDGINEPYISFRNGLYSFDGVIDDVKEDIKAIAQAHEITINNKD